MREFEEIEKNDYEILEFEKRKRTQSTGIMKVVERW